MKNDYDVIVVGAGAAGCVVAGYLSKHTNLSIAVIEAGGNDQDMMIHIPAGYSKILEKDKHVWKYETTPQHGTVRRFRMGKVLGGGTSINAMCYVRGQKRDFDAWQSSVGNTGDWSYETMWNAFIEQEKSDTFHNKHHGINGYLAVQFPHGINILNQYCMKAFQEYGLPYNPDYNSDKQIGVSPVQMNIDHQKRCSAITAHLRTHIESGRVEILSERIVSKVIMDGNKALGVELISGETKTELYAKHIILSAGAVQTPKVLMHSGIGSKSELDKFNIQMHIHLPGVGENFHDHPIIPISTYVKGTLGYQRYASGVGALSAGVRYMFTQDGPASSNGIETVSYWNPENFELEPTVQCYHEPIISTNGLSPTGKRSGITFATVVLQPQSRGWIRLADDNPLSMPLINPNFIGHNYDLNIGIQAVKAIRSVLKQPSLAKIVEEELMPGEHIQTDEEIADFVKRVATTMWHPVGSCKMGIDEMSVVDANLKVRGAENLYVMDASVMPNITSGNTNAPTQALALVGVKRFVQQLYC